MLCNLDDKGADVFLFQDGGVVADAVWEPGRVVVDVLDSDDDKATTRATGAATTASTVVGGDYVQLIGDLGLVERTDQGYDPCVCIDVERTIGQSAVCSTKEIHKQLLYYY